MNKYFSPIRTLGNKDLITEYADMLINSIELNADQRLKFQNSLKTNEEFNSNYKNNLKDELVKIAGTLKEELDSDDLRESFRPLTLFITKQLSAFAAEPQNLKYNIDVNDLANQINVFIKESLLSDVLIFELKNAKKIEILEGETEEERWRFYVNTLTNSVDWIEYIFEEYPVLAYKLAALTDNLINSVLELFIFLEADLTQLCDMFGCSKYPELSGVELFKSDLHNRGRSVHVLILDDKKILFKPKSLDSELLFKEIVACFNQIGAGLTLKYPKILSFTNHGWMEFITKEDCRNLNEASEFYFTQGKLTALFYLLGTGDLLDDNIIASGPYPCYIDLEALITEEYSEELNLDFPNALRRKIDEASVILSKLLPVWTQGNEYYNDNLSGGLIKTLRNDNAVFTVWENKGTDKMEQKKVRLSEVSIMEKINHLPTIEGKPVEIDNYFTLFKKGFYEMYDLILAEKENLLNDNHKLWKLLTGKKIRVILRNTSVYSRLLTESKRVTYASNFTESDKLFDHLFLTENKAMDESIINSELEQLNSYDIPFFYAFDNDEKLYKSGDIPVSPKAIFKKSIVNRLKQKLKDFGEEDLKFQMDIIDKSFNLYFDQKRVRDEVADKYVQALFENDSTQDISKELFKSSCLETAQKIGEHLLDEAHKQYGHIGWIGETMVGNDSLNHINFLNNDSYDGSAGIGLFFNQLFIQTKDKRFEEAATLIFEDLAELFDKYSFDVNQLKTKEEYFPLNGFNFPMNFFVLLANMELDFNEYYEKYKNKLYSILDFQLYHSSRIAFDYLSGLSSMLAVLLDIYAISKDDNLVKYIRQASDAIVQGGILTGPDKLSWEYLMTYEPGREESLQLGGFSHGTSGISAVLFRAGNILHDSKITAAAQKALNYDRSLFDKDLNGWLDLRNKKSCGVFYCHGASGIALSRLLLNQFEDINCDEELLLAKEIIIKKGLGHNQSICHGDLGNLEILQAICNHFNDTDTSGKIRSYLYNLSMQFLNEDKKFIHGSDSRNEIIGLFKGLAGIGYNYLRFYNWAVVPSILTLENKFCVNKMLH